MRIITLFTATLVVFLLTENLNAQTGFEGKIEILEAQKEKITRQEKEALKIEIKDINERLENGAISSEEAAILKKEVAKKRALNIENRIAIVENKIALLTRNQDGNAGLDSLQVDWAEMEEMEDDFIFGIKLAKKNKAVKYDKRTHSDLVIAFGLNNALIYGQSFSESPYKYLGSRFFEIGYAWSTRLLKEKGWLRLKYGVSFQFNGLKPTENRFFEQEFDEFGIGRIVLTDLPDEEGGSTELFKSKYRMDSFIIPVHLEFGPSVKKEYGNYTRFSMRKNFKFGIGGYFGFNYTNRQKVLLSRKSQLQTYSSARNSSNQRTIFGLSSYAGFGDASLYFKYELTQIFPGPSVKQNNISLGIRFDL